MSASPSSEPTSQAVPVCYRHPGRETYVRCRRCNRYICPDCMREDAVGFQCVECVAEDFRCARARTVFGGRIIARALCAWALLGLIGAVFAAQVVSSGGLVRLGTTADRSSTSSGCGAGRSWRGTSGTACSPGCSCTAASCTGVQRVRAVRAGAAVGRWLGHLRAALWG